MRQNRAYRSSSAGRCLTRESQKTMILWYLTGEMECARDDMDILDRWKVIRESVELGRLNEWLQHSNEGEIRSALSPIKKRLSEKKPRRLVQTRVFNIKNRPVMCRPRLLPSSFAVCNSSHFETKFKRSFLPLQRFTCDHCPFVKNLFKNT